mgnify:CR=1 FL=1
MARFTEDQFAAISSQAWRKQSPDKVFTPKPAIKPNQVGRSRPASRRMNKTEAAYASRLGLLKAAGEIVDYKFESINLRLSDKTWYKPDFSVYLPNGAMEFHEVKGHWEDDARVKIKVAAEQYPHRFVAVKKDKDDWRFEIFKGAFDA